jgi:hypothetical protein
VKAAPGVCSDLAPLVAAADRRRDRMAGLAINPVQGFWAYHLLYWVKFTFKTCFRRLLFVIRSPSYLGWSKTFLFGVGLTDLSDFGRYLGQNKAIVSVFNIPVSSFNVGVVLNFLARVVVLVTNFILFKKYKLAVDFSSDPVPLGQNLTTS